ncbi:hypothetical protein [uncultured Photobacterium sp.]|uniref:hypothetical protein n=1 Tax=uncultured Photobacterium sp. TaxID=173973 RepID=UPI00260BE550|nr:hypothetical protein [uncultured Photobacterium sp.]
MKVSAVTTGLITGLALLVMISTSVVLWQRWQELQQVQLAIKQSRHFVESAYSGADRGYEHLEHFALQHLGLNTVTLISHDVEDGLVSTFWSVSFRDKTNTMVFGLDGNRNWINPRALTMNMQEPEKFVVNHSD